MATDIIARGMANSASEDVKNCVNLTDNQEIDGQKDFKITPRIKVNGIGGEDHNLPENYNELNYIYINGGITGSNRQYIDTGIIPDHTLEFELKYSYENVGPGVSSGQGVVMGARVNSTTWVCTLSGFNTYPTGYFGFNNNVRSQAYLVQGDNIVSFKFKDGDTSKGIYTCVNSGGTNSYEISRSSGYPATVPTLYIGALHDGLIANENLNGKVYYVKIWKNGTLVREFYPCKHDAQIGLYDKVSNTLFTNIGIGEGDFTPGDFIKDHYENLLTNANIPTKTSQLVNDSGFITKDVNNLTNYTKTSDLATVSLSGNYNDLSNKPNILQITKGTGEESECLIISYVNNT